MHISSIAVQTPYVHNESVGKIACLKKKIEAAAL